MSVDNTLHIYAQYSEHDDARIAGTRPALEELDAAILRALGKKRKATSAPVFTNDGEGYTVKIECLTEAEAESSDLLTPYTYQAIGKEVIHWQERAFKAEAELAKLRKTAAPTPAPAGSRVSEYLVADNSSRGFGGVNDIRISLSRQIDGRELWAVRRTGDCLNKAGKWEYEPQPSSRNDGFLFRCRFDSAEAAIAAAFAVKGRP